MTKTVKHNMAPCTHNNVQAYTTKESSLLDNEIILKLMTKSCDTTDNTQNKICGLFVLIDQMINKYQHSDHHSNKQLKMIDTLLQRSQRTNVKILPPRNADMQDFVQKMLSNAESIEEHPSTHEPIIRKCARHFKDAFQEFFSLLKNKITQLFADNRECNLQSIWQILENFSEVHQHALKFMQNLVNFTYLFYQETIGRLLKLNPDQVNGRLNNSEQFLCAKAII